MNNINYKLKKINKLKNALIIIPLIILFQNCGNFQSTSLLENSSILDTSSPPNPNSGINPSPNPNPPTVNENKIELPEVTLHSSKPSQIRLLNGIEYSNTVKNLLNLDPSKSLDHADTSTGFSTGSNLIISDSLFKVLFREAESLADRYSTNVIEKKYSCFSKVNSTCITNFVTHFGSRAFRRNLSSEEVQSFVNFYNQQVSAGNNAREARKFLVQRILVSPNFLYRTEVGQNANGGKSLNDFEKASLISYSLTGSMPDELLFEDAQKGKLNYSNIRLHVKRIMKNNESKAWLTSFFKSWTGVNALDQVKIDPKHFPKFKDSNQILALTQEFDHFLNNILFIENGSLADLFNTNKGFVNRHTASIYGKKSTSEKFVPIEFNQNERKGILTLGSFLASHSSEANIDNDSPILRGSFVFNNLLCGEVGIPSGLDTNAAAENVLANTPNFDQLTSREQTEAILNQGPSCVACHNNFMPYGYTMSNFDATGTWRDKQNNRNVSSFVPVAKVDNISSSYQNIMELTQKISQSRDLHSCFTKNFLAFVSGKYEGPDSKYLTQLGGHHLMNNNKGNIFIMIEEMFSSPTMYKRR